MYLKAEMKVEKERPVPPSHSQTMGSQQAQSLEEESRLPVCPPVPQPLQPIETLEDLLSYCFKLVAFVSSRFDLHVDSRLKIAFSEANRSAHVR